MGSFDFSFPVEDFTVPGNPAQVRASATRYSAFAGTSTDAAGRIRSVNGGAWVGDEADVFRSRAGELPPPLEVAGRAFGEVSLALNGFAEALETATSRMQGEASHALATWNQLQGARRAVDTHTSQAFGMLSASTDQQQAFAVEGDRLSASLHSAATAWQGHLRTASSIRLQVQDAAVAAGRRIRAAGRTSPTAGQNWFERQVERAGNWIDERGAWVREQLAKVSGLIRFVGQAMKAIGIVLMVAAVLAAVLCVVAAPFTEGASLLLLPELLEVFLFGSTLYGAGDALETIADWADGKIDGRDLLVTGLTAVALAAVGLGGIKVVGRLIEKLGGRRIPDVLRRVLQRRVVPPGVKEGWVRRTADSGKGIVYQRPGATGNADMVRIMDPTARYPNGYVRFYNSKGQPLDLNGKPGPPQDTHIPRALDGSYPLPQGW